MKAPISKIVASETTQVREKIDTSIVEQYADDMKNGAVFPPITVFSQKESEQLIIADGFHRYHAASLLGLTEIEVNVFDGEIRDALLFALGANATHGLRRSNADKNKAVSLALMDPQIATMSLREVAKICQVSHMTVSRVRDAIFHEDLTRDRTGVTKLQDQLDTLSNYKRDALTQTEQDQRDLQALREVCAIIKSLPYNGGDAHEKLNLNEKDLRSLVYMNDWMAKAVTAMAGLSE